MVGIRFVGRTRVKQTIIQGNHAKARRNKNVRNKSSLAKSLRWCKISLETLAGLYHSAPWSLCLNFESLYLCVYRRIGVRKADFTF